MRKSRANPPEVIRQRLKHIIERITGGSKRVYTTKGKKLTQDGLNTVWLRNVVHNKINYSINRNHPILCKYISEHTEQDRNFFLDILRLIEGQFPVDAFYSDVSGSPESLAENRIEDEKLLELAELFYQGLEDQGVVPDEIRKQFERTEPFRNNVDLITHFLTTKGIINE